MEDKIKIGGMSFYDGIKFYSDNISVFVGEKNINVKIRCKSTIMERIKSYILFVPLFIISVLMDLSYVLPKSETIFGLKFEEWSIAINTILVLINYKTFYGFVLKSKKVARFHGAEHKAINAYNLGDYSLNGILAASRVADRCGTNIVVNLLVIYIPLLSILSLIGILGRSTISIAVALFISLKVFDKDKNPLKKIGDWTQKNITTKEPIESEVLIAKEGIELLVKAQGLYNSGKSEEIETLNKMLI